MDSVYSAPSGSKAFDPLDEGENSCPPFERLIQKAENENSDLVRLLEAETQQYSALHKELEDTSKERDKLESSSNGLNEEAKQLHKVFRQNKEISESLKKTNTLLTQHEETLQKKYETACFDLQQLKLNNFEVVEKYRNIWKRYCSFYESSELASHLASTKKTTQEIQKKAIDNEEKVKQLEIQLNNAEKEKKNMEETLNNAVKSSKEGIINLAELYIQASSVISHANDKFHQLQELQKKRQELENKIVMSTKADEVEEEQQMECEMESAESGGLQQKESVKEKNKGGTKGNPKHQQSSTDVLNNALEVNLHHDQEKNKENICRNSLDPGRKNFSPHQHTGAQQDTITLQSNLPTPQLCSPQTILNRSLNSNRTTALNMKGLTNYSSRFLSPYSQINTPTLHQSPILSPARTSTTQYQLFNTFAKDSTLSPQPKGWMHNSYDKSTDQGVNSGGQTGLKTSSETRDKTAVTEQTKVPLIECQEQMVEDNYSAISTPVAKSPGPNYNPISPKTPTTGYENMDIFDFTEYSEKIRLLNKSPGEGFSYQSRPMFNMVENMDDDDSIPTTLPGTQPSFFQPFFASRETESNDQFTGKPTFLNMSPETNKEDTVQQGNQFQVEKDQSSSISNSSNLFSKSSPAEECGISTGVGFSLFADQSSSKLGSHGNKSPAFSFNFCTSPLSIDPPTSQNGTFNLF